MRRAILAAVLAVGGVATAQAQYTKNPDASVSCQYGPGQYVQRLNGQLLIACPPAPITRRQADEADRQWLQRHDAEVARMAEARRKAEAAGREEIIETCTNPDPSINRAWCANQMARIGAKH